MDDTTKDVLSQPTAASKKPNPPIGELLVPVWAKRTRIIVVSVAVAAITLGINFLLPVSYKATATLMPETEESKLSALGQFAGIAQMAGVSVSGSDIARLYPAIVTSETILRAVIERRYRSERYADSVNLVQYFDLREGSPEKDMAAAFKKMQGLLIASIDNRTSIVSLSLEMREPRLAADVLNAVIEELDKFMRSKRVTSASEQVRWIDVRIGQVQQELRRDEDALRDFRERNRRIADSPQLLLVQQRLLRNVEVNSAVYVELKKQYELSKLEEIKNITIVNVLDKGRAPVRKESPKRATNTAIMFLLTLIGLSGYYAAGPVYGQSLRDFWARVKGSK